MTNSRWTGSRSRRVAMTIAASVAVIAVGACSGSGAPAAQEGGPTLREAFDGDFLVGAALNRRQFSGQDTAELALILSQFNQVSPENVLKWESVNPRKGVYTFDAADQYVAFGEQHGMSILGHNLVWHNQTPAWVFEDDEGNPVSRDTLLGRMRDHIMTVVGRYRGRINGWDVVNEALNEDGTLRQSKWLQIIGEDYIAKAFQYANEADPSAELYYNDYSLENPAKRAGAIALISDLQKQGIRIDGVGLQGHVKMDWPSAALEDSTITDFANLGIKVNISELDVDVLPPANRGGAEVTDSAAARAALNPYATALPDSMEQALARRYADLFRVYVKHADDIERVTFWGVTNADSWLNNWPVRGRTAYPLLFDRQGQTTAAYDSVIATARD